MDLHFPAVAVTAVANSVFRFQRVFQKFAVFRGVLPAFHVGHSTCFLIIILLQPFPYFGVGAASFQSPRPPFLCVFNLESFLLSVFSYSITLPQFLSHYFPCYSINLSLLHILHYFSPYGLTISVSLSYFLTYVSHACPCSYFFISDLLDILSILFIYHHPSQHSHFCSFWQVGPYIGYYTRRIVYL